jgi:cobalt transporter subunit CbtA
VDRFRSLVYIVLASGTIAGLLLFAVQHFTTFPLIEKAEVYELAAEKSDPHHHEDENWRPAEGIERTLFTVLTTALTGVGFSAILFGVAGLASMPLNWKRGLLWGLAAFVCVDLAPSLGLPPQPPGTAVADLYARQEWWAFTVVSTAIAMWLLLDRRRSWKVRLIGVPLAILPHAIGAPVAVGNNVIPAALIQEFGILSLLTTGLFWIALGAIGGLLYGRSGNVDARLLAD